MSGTLYVVATPIGNLEDLTFRALRTLREVDLIAAEDTRRTSKLLAHYEIRKSLISLREHNEARETPRLLERLAAGESIALVSDAGTPTIADPGARLVRAAHERGLPVVPVPGPSAIVTALSVSGLSGDQFVFMGFPPSSGIARKRWVTAIAAEPRITVFFEAPHRIQRTLGDLTPILVNKPIVLARELTKRFEQVVIQPIIGAHALAKRGEFTVIIGAAPDRATSQPVDAEQTMALYGRLTKFDQFDDDEAVAIVAAVTGHEVSEVKKSVKKSKILADRLRRSAP